MAVKVVARAVVARVVVAGGVRRRGATDAQNSPSKVACGKHWGIGLIDEPRKQRFVRDHGPVFVEHLEAVEALGIRQVAGEIVCPRTRSFGQLPSRLCSQGP